MRKSLFLLALVCGAALVAPGGARAQKAPKAPKADAPKAEPQKPSTPKSAPAEAAPPKVTELKEAGLRELLEGGRAAGRPLLINFWATWCVPCREEFPDLVKLRAAYPADKLGFALISLDDPSDIAGSVPAFLAEMRATDFASYLLNADDSDAAINLIDPTWHGELPATFLFDRQGKVVYNHKGRIKVPELTAALDAALKN